MLQWIYFSFSHCIKTWRRIISFYRVFRVFHRKMTYFKFIKVSVMLLLYSRDRIILRNYSNTIISREMNWSFRDSIIGPFIILRLDFWEIFRKFTWILSIAGAVSAILAWGFLIDLRWISIGIMREVKSWMILLAWL